MSEKLRSYSSAVDAMKAPPGFFASAAFSHLRWTLAGEQRDERARLFTRKLLKRLDHLDMPFYPAVGLMDHRTALWRYSTGMDPWKPMESPFLDGTGVEFRHCLHEELDPKCWSMFAEVGFDVARLMQVPVVWGGFSEIESRPGLFVVYDRPALPVGMCVDRRTYGERAGALIDMKVFEERFPLANPPNL